jgi:hypothetical protein
MKRINQSGVQVEVGESHLERVEGQVDIRAVFVTARRGIALHHLYGVLGESARGRLLPAPVRVHERGDDLAAL